VEGLNDIMSIQLLIPGKPIAKHRPRFARRGKFVTTYNDQQTEEGKWIQIAMSKMIGFKPFRGPVALEIEFCMPIPKSTSNKKRGAMIRGEIMHTKKPDLDNLEKFVKDCLNGLAWKDDAQVCKMCSEKYYSENPATIIKINEI
jgi:Holliday junction resolvase RusA-like endonuclease